MSKVNPSKVSRKLKRGERRENFNSDSSSLRRGEIYWIELDPVKGSEIQKTRPCLIISNNEQNEVSRRVMAIPLTSSRKLPPAPFHVSFTFQNKFAKILPEQMRVIDKSRIKGKCLGRVSWEILDEIEEALHIVLDLKI
jgi:mRNA interferase MazF